MRERGGGWNPRTISRPVVDPRSAERRQRLLELVNSGEWKDLVEPGLRTQRKRTMERGMNPHAEDRELRECQERYAVLTLLLERPVEFLLAVDEGE